MNRRLAPFTIHGLAPDVPRNLCQRGGNDDALFLAAAEGGEQPILEVARTGGRERLSRDRDVPGSLDLERGQVRISSHEDDFERREVEYEVGVLWHDGHPPRHRRARYPQQIKVVEGHTAARGLKRAGQRTEQRRFPRTVRSEDSDEAVGRHVKRDAAKHRRPERVIREGDVSGPQQPSAPPSHYVRAPGSRALPRSRD